MAVYSVDIQNCGNVHATDDMNDDNNSNCAHVNNNSDVKLSCIQRYINSTQTKGYIALKLLSLHSAQMILDKMGPIRKPEWTALV